MENILILLAITSAAIIGIMAQVYISNRGSRIDELDNKMNWQIIRLDDRLFKADQDIKLAAKDNDQLKGQVKRLESRIAVLEDNFRRLEDRIAKLTELLEAKPEPEDNKMAEQWDNVINYNPLKDLEVGREN